MKKKRRIAIGMVLLAVSGIKNGFADPAIPSVDKDKKGDAGIALKDFEKRNQHAEEVLIAHNKHVVVAPPSVSPDPSASNPVPPNPAPLPRPSPVFSVSRLPDPIPVPDTAALDHAKEPVLSKSPDPVPPGNSPATAPSPNVPAAGASSKSSFAKSEEKTDGGQQKKEELTEKLTPAVFAAEILDPKKSIKKTAELDQEGVRAGLDIREKGDSNPIAIKAKRLDASQLAGLKDRRVEGDVIYNNYTSDISSLMAGEIGIVSDSLYYFVRFSNEESKKIAKGASIKAYLTEPHSLEGEILWKGKLEMVENALTNT